VKIKFKIYNFNKFATLIVQLAHHGVKMIVTLAKKILVYLVKELLIV